MRRPWQMKGEHAGSISSKEVNQALREIVWPALKPHGFTRRTARTGWRDGPDQIDVVNFQSFNSYNAGVLGVTSFSFAINLGVFPRCRPATNIKQKDGELRPEEYECDFRHRVRRALRQSHGHADIWFVEPDASNLAIVVDDVRERLLDDGLSWFRQLDGLDAMYAKATEAPEDMSATWGMGNIGSPHRRALVADLSRALQRRDPA